LREEASDYQSWTPDPVSEPWRSALEEVWTKYCADHYHNGISAVFGFSQNGQITLTACIEDHQYQPKNYWLELFYLLLPIFFTIKTVIHY
jgi:capping protein alpha